MKNFSEKYKKATPGGRRFVKQIAVFLIVYIILLGAHSFISQRLYGFSYAMNDSWILLTPFIIFPVILYYRWNQVRQLPSYGISLIESVLFVVLGLLVVFFPLNKFGVLDLESGGIVFYFVFALGFYLFFLGFFGRRVVRYFFKEIVLIFLLFFAFTLAQILVLFYWQYLSSVIIRSLSLIMPVFFPEIIFDFDKYNVALNGFSVMIGPVCVGVFSIVTFVCLYSFVLFWVRPAKRIRWFLAAAAGLLGVCALFVFNIVRVAIIIAVGGMYSEEFAISLFHEYLSAVILLGVFIVFLYRVIPWIVVDEAVEDL